RVSSPLTICRLSLHDALPISYMVARRRNEIGIRMAMGADKRSILRMILREAMGLLGAGLAIGIVLVLGAGGVGQAMLYGVKANEIGRATRLNSSHVAISYAVF